jgi:hypothetical protein
MTEQNPAFASFSYVVISTIIGAAVIHELIGPHPAEAALKKDGEIRA